MSQFTQGMDVKFSNLSYTENGAPQLKSSLNPSIDYFFNVVRGMEINRLKYLLNQMLEEIQNTTDHFEKGKLAADLFVTIFQLRATRGMGKGERDLFVKSISHVYNLYPDTTKNLLFLIPHYGCFKDLLEIAVYEEANINLKKVCLDIFAIQLQKDEHSDTPSLAGKWAPREGKSYDKKGKVVSYLCNNLFPNEEKSTNTQGVLIDNQRLSTNTQGVLIDNQRLSTQRKMYRNLVVSLTKKLQIPEVLMSANKWSELEFAKISALCLEKNKKAFLNEDLKNLVKDTEEETGNRFPNNDDRVQCRKNLIDTMVNTGIKGQQLFANQIVQKINPHLSLGTAEKILCVKQWESIRNDVLEKMKDENSNAKNLGYLLPLVDVSGSMSGDPMEVAIALGILVSELNDSRISNRCITFETNPQYFKFDPKDNIIQKVLKLRQAPWGGYTDFAKALDMIYHIVDTHKLKKEEVPNLIVFSDMQFNQADSGFNTEYESIKLNFAKLGKKISGEEYDPPKIIFWNLRGNSHAGIHAPVEATVENVQLLSGFSQSMLKLVLEGEFETEETVESVDEYGNVVVEKVKRKTTPYDTYRKAIDNECFNQIREILSSSNEKELQHYNC
jgi:Mg-chelatase subunit ChlD